MCNMFFLTSLLIVIISTRVEGLTVTSVSTSPMLIGSSVTLKFCDYTLSAGESVTDIVWEFTAYGGTKTQMAFYSTALDFNVLNTYTGRLTRPDPSSGYLHLTGITASDNGTYSCTVKTVGSNSSTSREVVFDPPDSANLTLELVNCSFQCKGLKSGGTPHVFLQIVSSSSDTPIAQIESLTVVAENPDNGDYYCRARWITFPNFIIPGVMDSPVVTFEGSTTPESSTIESTATGISSSTETIAPTATGISSSITDGTSSIVSSSVATSSAPTFVPEHFILIIVLSCIASFILIIIIVGLVIFCMYRRRRSHENKSKDNHTMETHF